MTRSKDPTAGACASCRKEIPLVPDDQGDLVLREHHVVTSDQGYDVVKCPGSRKAASSLDDSKDWAWVPSPAPPSAEETAAIAGLSAAFTRLGAAVATAQATQQDSFTLRPSCDDDGATVRINTEPPASSAQLLAEIVTAVRQAYADRMGEVPTDAAIHVETNWNAAVGLQVLTLRLPVGRDRIGVTVPFSEEVARDPEARDALAQRAAETVRRELNLRLGCDARSGPHFCATLGSHRIHGCVVPACRMTWTNLEAPHGTS